MDRIAVRLTRTVKNEKNWNPTMKETSKLTIDAMVADAHVLE